MKSRISCSDAERCVPYPWSRLSSCPQTRASSGVLSTTSVADRVLGRLQGFLDGEISDGTHDHSSDVYLALFEDALAKELGLEPHEVEDVLSMVRLSGPASTYMYDALVSRMMPSTVGIDHTSKDGSLTVFYFITV